MSFFFGFAVISSKWQPEACVCGGGRFKKIIDLLLFSRNKKKIPCPLGQTEWYTVGGIGIGLVNLQPPQKIQYSIGAD